MIDTTIPEGVPGQPITRPPLPLVVASVVSAVAVWVPIYLRAGHLIWFW